MSKNRLLVIGGDSFIASKFIRKYSNDFVIKSYVLKKTEFKHEVLVADFGNISNNEFINIDVVINFAAIVHHPDIEDENIYDEVNHKLAVSNAQKSKRSGVKLYIQMSSIAVYGNISKISIDSSYNPNTPYGCSKLKADEELLKLQDENFNVAVVRPPMVYGGGKAPGNMLRLINFANKRIPLPFKNIDNKRDFININNLIQYLSIIAEKKLNGIYLISDNEPVSTEYLLNTIYKYLNNKGLLINVPNFMLRILKTIRPKEYSKLFGTMTIKTNFPFENLIKRSTVEEGIAEMIAWYKNI